MKTGIVKITTLKHYDPNAEIVLTSDASTLGLGPTLWLEDTTGRRAVAIASKYLNPAEKDMQSMN